MKIQVLEFGQSDSESPKHSITSGKAKCLVDELGWAVRVSKRVIRICIAKSWSVIKTWLQTTKEQRKQAQQREEARVEWVLQNRARSIFPGGAEYGFSRWPCEDQRSIGIGV
ncbi:MAG: hypothetical protein JWQ87_5495 [Candidatus Sulfotelmatobacter sp.]|nr:hypothetical protein [Candidatus Sulfotelmatobacter sp.]